MEALAPSFEALTTLLSLVPSSICHSVLRLLSYHCHLEADHLSSQQTDLRSSSRLLFHKLLLGRVNPFDGVD